MPNQPNQNRVSILIRLPSNAERDRIDKVIAKLNNDNPGANYSRQSFCLAAIMEAVKEAEET